ncbi:STAS domain-containing protein [Actinosynnema pretiosum subsp. pretiosum]|uniref:Anti-sigma factor antagonist n=1 Tax=Actinosynnema pretiosum subsp. pretiosum TaxID=103721 RepID=A0AA45L7F4_9PSEU|nr:Anti-sigma F factor antagonist (spoIIAA-2), Anti-sigma B factor antagonist RsbV [Actinosynnema pretiosum subsp. pretiosum]QUF04228.1 STAS domain-containing protein [Actinosynnema pretiosum subsp. pretiosum]
MCPVPSTLPHSPTADAVVVRVSGELDASTTGPLRARLLDEVSRAPSALVVDLGAVTFCSAAGLSLLLATTADAERLGVPWAVVGAQRAVRRPVTAAGLDAVLRLRDDVASALTALAPPNRWDADLLG